MVPLPRPRLRLLLEVHQILVGPSRSRLGTNFRQPEVREWPKFLRVRVSGGLNYTKVLTGNAAERSAGCI